jgi:thiol-disulfide isomerase/thioredoxin
LKLWLLVAAFGALAFAQSDAGPPPAETEQEHFRRVMSEAGASPSDLAQALEEHLARYPDTPQRAALERTIVQAAIDAGDRARILRYGERVAEREPNNLIVLERLTRALLDRDDPATARKAFQYASQLEAVLRKLEIDRPPENLSRARIRDELDQRLGKAFVYQARAKGNLGELEEAVKLARKSYQTYPSAEAAREAGRWLARLGRSGEAIEAYADAFAIPDENRTEEHRAADRRRLQELYLKEHSSEAGLGDLVLAAYDRTASALEARLERLRQLDPNFGRKDPLEYTLEGLDGERLALSSLRGKVIVLDFWATWCGPCRVQQPLYEEVMARFAGRDDVVFLNVNTDDNRAAVAPFLEANGWNKRVYFDAGLQQLLKVTSIPTTIIFDKQGRLAGRLIGFDAGRFVSMLSERIHRALAAD